MQWSDLLAAIALLIIAEGLMPFVAPEGWKQMVTQIARLPGLQLRVMGLVMVISGSILLYWVRNG